MAGLPQPVPDCQLRLLRSPDLPAYKALRDAMLAGHPQAFTSDAATEIQCDAASYHRRLSGGAQGATLFTLCAWNGPEMVGAVSCEHQIGIKVRHVAQIIAMMVRDDWQRLGIGQLLMGHALKLLQAEPGLELVTLSVTASNAPALRLYERCGFQAYGRLQGAIKLPGGELLDKCLMSRRLR